MLRPYIFSNSASFPTQRPRLPGVLDPPTPSPSPQPRSRRAHTPASFDSPPFPPFHAHFAHALHEALAHLQELGALDRGEVSRHFAIFILVNPDHLGPSGTHPVHELVHAVRIRRNAGSHLAVERAPALELLLHHRTAARAEA